MSLSLVVAQARNRVIGRSGGLPWKMLEDMKFFVALTMHHTVIMGRVTWQSLYKRPLPGRRNVVLSRDPDFVAPQARVVSSVEQALAELREEEECMVIGGGDIYRVFLPFADCIYLTEIEAEFEGDTLFPELDENQWREAAEPVVVESRGPTLRRRVLRRRLPKANGKE